MPLGTRQERGATIVEFAFVGVLLFTFVFVLISFSVIEAGNSVGSNAARDGARTGIVNPDCVDSYSGSPTAGHDGCAVDSEPNYLNLIHAVSSKLVGLVGTPVISVSCFSMPANTTENCFRGTYTVDQDELQVTVTYTSVATSAFTAPTRHTQSARMVIVGAPTFVPTTTTTTTTPAPCSVTPSTSTVSPNPATINGGGHLTADLTIVVHTTGSCPSTVFMSINSHVSPAPQTATIMGSSGTYTWTISSAGSGSTTWTAGCSSVAISASASSAAAYTGSPIFFPIGTGHCPGP